MDTASEDEPLLQLKLQLRTPVAKGDETHFEKETTYYVNETSVVGRKGVACDEGGGVFEQEKENTCQEEPSSDRSANKEESSHTKAMEEDQAGGSPQTPLVAHQNSIKSYWDSLH
ncbi:Uncharacterized protein Adt_06495 [Abeliophyllum distichum]|uniref:Uncharacterized protein n=1 Tax=Abeliophyllum distichum TaxID=126358 RepID=A0ABD1V738_9LAMI